MEYIEIKDNIIVGHYSSNMTPTGSQYKKVNNKFKGLIGDNINKFDSNLNLLSDKELIKKGVYFDKRGIYYDINTKEKHEIKGFNEEPKENWTSEVPDITDRSQVWNSSKKKWIIDKKLKKNLELNKSIEEKELYLNNTDWYIIRKLEINKEIPKKILKKRKKIRDELSDLKKASI